jgi:ribosome-binding ATPase
MVQPTRLLLCRLSTSQSGFVGRLSAADARHLSISVRRPATLSSGRCQALIVDPTLGTLESSSAVSSGCPLLTMQIGILGAPGSGKTTVFNALAQARAQVGGYSARDAEPNVAVVKVPDERLSRLAAIYRPKRVVPAEVTYLDVGGIVSGAGRDGASAFLAQLRTADMLLQVVRAFANLAQGPADPLDELQTVQLELLLADLGVVERRLERLRKEAQLGKGTSSERQLQALELDLFERLRTGLEAERPVRDLELTDGDLRLMRTYALLTAKPLLVLVNVEEPGAQADALVQRVAAVCEHASTGAIALAGKLEMELQELTPEEAAEFMPELGLTESGRERVIRLSYQLSQLITFFTVKSDECRAWSLPAGGTAVEAAGAIHEDLARGFIRAEVVSYGDLVACGSQAEARKRGLLRSEGKGYRVADGDVIEILFNV